MNTNPSFDASVLRGLEFELAYLASLTRAGLKPLSRWEKPFGPATQQALHELGLKSRVVTRTVQSGKRLRELIFSTSKDCLDGYARRFDQQAVERTAAADLRLRDAIETIPEAFVLWDSDNRLVLCNSKYQQFHSLPASVCVPGTAYEDLVRSARLEDTGEIPVVVARPMPGARRPATPARGPRPGRRRY